MNSIIDQIQQDISGLTQSQINDYFVWLDSIIVRLAD